MNNSITIREVGLRDGLQLAKTKLATDTKIKWCEEQFKAGFSEIEVTSFVSKLLLPQFADSYEVLIGSQEFKGLLSSVLVPNLVGGIRAMNAGAKKINFVLSASEEHNKSNVNNSTATSLSMFKEFVQERNAKGLQNVVEISGAIATSFGCSIQGKVSEKLVLKISEKLTEYGADEINLADTAGFANPIQVESVFKKVSLLTGNIPLAGHFHDTRGMGLANVKAAFNAGVKRFDTSLGGLGGCPFAPGASGNIATEDCVYMFECMGINTGVNIQKLLEVRKNLNKWMHKDTLYGNLIHA